MYKGPKKDIKLNDIFEFLKLRVYGHYIIITEYLELSP